MRVAAWPQLLLALLLFATAAAGQGADIEVGTSDELSAAVSAPASGPLRIRLGPGSFQLDQPLAIFGATPLVELVGSGPLATSIRCGSNLTTAIVVEVASFRLQGISFRGCQGPALLLLQPPSTGSPSEWRLEDASFSDNGGGQVMRVHGHAG
jgi:hypothetical protein